MSVRPAHGVLSSQEAGLWGSSRVTPALVASGGGGVGGLPLEVTDPRGSGLCCCLLCGAAPTASLGVRNRGSLWRRRFGFVCGCWDSGRWLAARTPVRWPRCAGAAAAGDRVPRTCAALRRGWRCCSLSKGLFPALSQGAAGHKDKRGLAAVRGRLCSEQPVRAPAGCGGFFKRKLFCSRVGPGCFGAAP